VRVWQQLGGLPRQDRLRRAEPRLLRRECALVPRTALLERRHRRPAATFTAPRRRRLGTQQALLLQRVPQLVDLLAHSGALLGAHVGQRHGLLGRARLPEGG